MSRPDEYLGDAGEDEFKRWCSLAGLNATKASPDRMGWDFFVEFDPPLTSGTPFDTQNDLKKVLVQVKSRTRRAGGVRGKLSALRRLAAADMPAFIACLDFSRTRKLTSAALLHIEESETESILRAVRRAEAAGRLDLHEVKIALPLKRAHPIAADGENLKQLLEAAMPGTAAEYIAKKAEYRNRCGFDLESFSADFSLEPDATIEDFVNLNLGMISSLPVSDFVVHEKRFGIVLPDAACRIARKGIITVDRKPIKQANINILSPNRHERVAMVVDVYSPGIPGLPLDAMKLRCANEFLEVTLQGTNAHVNFAIDPEKTFSLPKLAHALKYAVAMAEDGAEIEIDLDSSRPQSGFPTPKEAAKLRRWNVLSEFVDMLSLAFFRHRPDVVIETTLGELEKALSGNRDMFSIMARPGLQASVRLDDDWPKTVPAKGQLVIPAILEFQSFAYVAMVKAIAKLRVVKDVARLKGEDPIIAEGSIVDRVQLDLQALNARASALAFAGGGRGRFAVALTLATEDGSHTPGADIAA